MAFDLMQEQREDEDQREHCTCSPTVLLTSRTSQRLAYTLYLGPESVNGTHVLHLVSIQRLIAARKRNQAKRLLSNNQKQKEFDGCAVRS